EGDHEGPRSVVFAEQGGNRAEHGDERERPEAAERGPRALALQPDQEAEAERDAEGQERLAEGVGHAARAAFCWERTAEGTANRRAARQGGRKRKEAAPRRERRVAPLLTGTLLVASLAATPSARRARDAARS